MKKVYFYATCLGSAAMQQSVLNAIKLLRREGIEVIFKKIKPVVLNLLLTQVISMKVVRLLYIM